MQFASLGDENSSRNLFSPGLRYISALKWESQTGQYVGGKSSSSRLTVKLPSIACTNGSAMVPYIERIF